MVSVTPGAALQIGVASRQSGAQGLGLRIAAKRVADGSIQYGMGFDEPRNDDQQITSEGVAILVAPMSEAILKDTVLDFVELNPGEFQFVFINPNDVGMPPDDRNAGGCGSGGCGSGGCGSSGGGCA